MNNTNPLVAAAKDLIKNKGLKKDITAQHIMNLASDEAHPELFEDALKEIAEQGYDPMSEKSAIKLFGKDLVEIAKALHPEMAKSEDNITPLKINEVITKRVREGLNKYKI